MEIVPSISLQALQPDGWQRPDPVSADQWRFTGNRGANLCGEFLRENGRGISELSQHRNGGDLPPAQLLVPQFRTGSDAPAAPLNDHAPDSRKARYAGTRVNDRAIGA
jgi:hypothetical protein